MDISQFLDVRCDVVDDVEEVDLPILPSTVVKKPTPGPNKKTGNPLKRSNPSSGVPSPVLPPSKRAKPAPIRKQNTVFVGKKGGVGSPIGQPKTPVGRVGTSPLVAGGKRPGGGLVPSPAALNARNNARPGGKGSPHPGGGHGNHGPGNPVSWKYRQLPENLYNADIKKAELLKTYEPEKCICKAPDNDEPACTEGCYNRSTYTECDKELCPHGERCSNQRLQRRQYAPGLERFMTQKKGWGVRARQSIPSGTLILEYMGELCSSAEFEKRMMTRYKGDTHHYCLALDSKTVIDAQRAGSECRFVNHACDPNCEMQKWNVNGLYRMAVFAKRDILPGEEITYDYNFSLFDRNQGQVCKCGAKNCRGVIGGKGKDYLIAVDSNKKTVVSSSPAALNNQISADAKFFATKIPAEEFAWIKSNAPKPNQLDNRQIKCTVCNACLNFRDRGAVQRHPDLGVVLCVNCRQSYGRGGWPKDQQGSDEFCRWCSEGGQIYLCDFCPKAFCHKCLKWNLGKKYVTKIDEEEKWQCLACDGKLLKSARALFYGIHLYQKATNTTASPATNGKPAKTTTPKKQAGKQQAKSTPAILNGRNNLTVIRHVPSPAQQSPVPAPRGSPALPRHFVDSMLLEADRACNRMRTMINEIRKGWINTGMKKARNDKTICDATNKIRQCFVQSIEGINKADDKVMTLYNANMKVPLKPVSQNGNKRKRVGSVDTGNKDKILDVSVDELEANGEPTENGVKEKDDKEAGNDEEYVPIEVDIDIEEGEEGAVLTNGDQNSIEEVKLDDDDDEPVEIEQKEEVNGELTLDQSEDEKDVKKEVDKSFEIVEQGDLELKKEEKDTENQNEAEASDADANETEEVTLDSEKEEAGDNVAEVNVNKSDNEEEGNTDTKDEEECDEEKEDKDEDDNENENVMEVDQDGEEAADAGGEAVSGIDNEEEVKENGISEEDHEEDDNVDDKENIDESAIDEENNEDETTPQKSDDENNDISVAENGVDEDAKCEDEEKDQENEEKVDIESDKEKNDDSTTDDEKADQHDSSRKEDEKADQQDSSKNDDESEKEDEIKESTTSHSEQDGESDAPSDQTKEP